MSTGRKSGRPRKGAPPRIPYEELDRILVFGEVVPCEDGENTTVAYPSYRDLARRFGVSHSLVAQYAKKHNCMRRREEAQARVAARADQKLIELRAGAIAMSKVDALRIIDSYLAGFEKALAEGRVRFDNPGDFNTMLRLKEFIQGGADSRQEIHAALSLEELQSRHRRMLQTFEASSPALRGVVPSRAALSRSEQGHGRLENTPASAIEAAPEKVDGKILEPGVEPSGVDAPRASVRAAGRAAPEPASNLAAGAENATAAPSAPQALASRPEDQEP
jgi:hypothetical protein